MTTARAHGPVHDPAHDPGHDPAHDPGHDPAHAGRPALSVGLVGLGAIARYYLAALRDAPSARLAAVCDVDAAALAPFRDRVPCHVDHRSMLAAGGLDAVVVTTPNDVHAAICDDVLVAGLPVCVEKPLATRLADGERVVARARALGLPLMTAFHRRYNANVRALAGRIAGRAPVASLTVRYLERIEDHIGAQRWYLDPERCGGGCVADNGPNALDLATLFLGPLRLTGAAIARDEHGIDRRAELLVAGASGARGRIELDWSHRGERKDVELRLADGTVERCDMLAGHRAFKGSLWHEYRAIVERFAALARGDREHDDGGLTALALVAAAYGAERLVTGRE